jgi:hypothetical protein
MNIQQNQQRLSQERYNRPDKTIQDKLTKEEIAEKLQGYVKVDNIAEVPLNTHLRYFTTEINKKTGATERKFRLGGFLTNNLNNKKYIILSNGKLSWSVQTENTIFFRKKSIEEIINEYEDKLKNKDNIIDKLEDKVLLLKKRIKELKKR